MDYGYFNQFLGREVDQVFWGMVVWLLWNTGFDLVVDGLVALFTICVERKRMSS